MHFLLRRFSGAVNRNTLFYRTIASDHQAELRTSHEYAPPPVTQLSEEETTLKETVRKFANDVIKPIVREMDRDSHMPQSIITACFQNGFMGVEVPAKYDGPETSFFNSISIVEELARIDASVAILVDVHNTLVVPVLIKYGTDEQKQKYLPKVHSEWVGSFCLSEESSGSDAFALKTTAKVDGDDFVINGTKMWITNAGNAKFFLVMANVDISKGYRGITCFIVDRDAPGLTVNRPEDKLGIRASSTCPVHFDNVRVHKSAIVGEYGKGYKYAIEFLNSGRIGIGAQMLGVAQGCFEQTFPYLLQRKQFGKRIADFQVVQHQLASMAVDIETARLLIYNAARLKENNLPYIKNAAMAKLHASNVATHVTSLCVELMGGVGFTKEFPIEKFYRDCKIGTIYEGTSNIQLETIYKIISTDYQ